MDNYMPQINFCQKNDYLPFEKQKKKPRNRYINNFKAFNLAGAEGLEPSARGFGDRCSTN